MSDLDLIYGTKPKPPADPEQPAQQQPQTTKAPLSDPSSTKKQRSTKVTKPRDTTQPRHRDTTTPRNHDTVIPQSQTDIFEQVRKSVKQIGKEAATFRYTLEEKNVLEDIKYTYKRQGIRTSENEITRIATNYFIEDYRKNGEQSLLAKVLKLLNS